MNEKDILYEVSPYLNDSTLTYNDFRYIFEDKYTQNEMRDIINILIRNDIRLSDDYDEESDDSETEYNPYSDDEKEEIRDNFRSEEADLVNLYDKSEKRTATKEKSKDNFKHTNEELCEMIKQGDNQAKNDICIKNRGLVLKYAKEMKKHYGNSLELDDLEQVGYMGLMKAVEKYDSSRGAAFSTFATYWIRNAMSTEISEQGFSVRIPAHAMEKINKISKLENKYNSLGYSRNEQISLICKELDMSEKVVRKYMKVRKDSLKFTSLDAEVGENKETKLEELIEDTNVTAIEDDVERKVISSDLIQAISELSVHEQRVLKLKFGLEGDGEKTADEIAEIMGITTARVRTIEAKAMRRMRRSSVIRNIKKDS